MKKRVSCSGKVRHKTLKGALISSRKLKKEKDLIGKAYKCQRCGFYHVGKPSFLDDPQTFWSNIFKQMSEHDLKVLRHC